MEFTEPDSDISFVSSGRPSSVRSSSVFYDHVDYGRNARISTSSDRSVGSACMKNKFAEPSSPDQLFSEENIVSICLFSSNKVYIVKSKNVLEVMVNNTCSGRCGS